MFYGNIVALVTPMHADGSIDESAFQQLIEWQIQENIEGIVVNGTTGESGTTTPAEKSRLLTLAKQQIKGRVPLIAGTGTNNTTSTITLTQEAKYLGVDACLIVTPYYNRPTQKGLEAHYGAIAMAVDIPILLYNVPSRTACDIKPETVALLSQQCPNIVGIKEATGDIERLKALLTQVTRLDFSFLSGDDATALGFMQAGGHGVISVTSNIEPRQMSNWCNAAVEKAWTKAETLFNPLTRLHKDLFIESNPIPTKWVLHHRDMIDQGIRLPLTWLDPIHESLLKESLAFKD